MTAVHLQGGFWLPEWNFKMENGDTTINECVQENTRMGYYGNHIHIFINNQAATKESVLCRPSLS